MSHPFDRITYTEKERERSKQFWESARSFYDHGLSWACTRTDSGSVAPGFDSLVIDRTTLKDEIKDFADAVWNVVYKWERLNTERVKRERALSEPT